MSETPSAMIPLGSKAPDFRLLDTQNNNYVTLNDLKSSIATVVMFLCNHCPYVKHIEDRLISLARSYQAKGISFIAISSNDVVNYPEDGPEQMHHIATEKNYPFPYLYDETQEVAKHYHAACTPDFFVFNDTLNCVYRGQFDGSTPGNNIPVTGEALEVALLAILEGKPVNPNQKPSLGCNIKWRRNNDVAV